MTLERREQLAQQLSDQLRGLEDAAISRVRGIFTAALAQTIGEVGRLLDRFAEQPEYDPEETPGAFLGSTPDGPARITPDEKNLAAFYLQSQLLQDLTATLGQMALSPEQMEQLDAELRQLFDRAQELGEQYALQMVGAEIQPALQAVAQGPRPELDPVLALFPDREYQEGQRFTRLFDLAGAVAAAERDFTSLAANYWRQRDEATDEHVRAAKAYYGRWWNDWGETVRFTVGREMAAGPDPRRVKRELEKRIPTVNEAFHNRAETIARTETLMASGEAQDRTYRQLRVPLVQYVATADDRTCEFCAPRAGCLYWIGTVKTPIHPNCRCDLTPVTLESLVLQNAFAAGPEEHWETEARATANGIVRHYRRANGDRPMRPVGGQGEVRGERDWPLMERTGLPALEPRRGLDGSDPMAHGSRQWPKGDPVWCPRRGWLDQNARMAYEEVVREVAAL